MVYVNQSIGWLSDMRQDMTIQVMRTDDEKRAFSKRLTHALKTKGIPAGPTKLADLLSHHVQGVDGQESVSPQAVDKWLKGRALPAPERMQMLASILGVTEKWLRYGIVDTASPDGVDLTGLAESERLLVLLFRNLSREKQALVHQLVMVLGEPGN